MIAQQKHKITAYVLIWLMIFTLIPTIPTRAAAGYGPQPENAEELRLNSIEMLNPSDITPLEVTDTHYLNQINGTLDGTKQIKFTFIMGSGMSSFNEAGFKERNMPIIKVYDQWGSPAAEYSGGKGALQYLGAIPSKEINIGIPAGTLESGEYTLEFGKDVCGNNTEKRLGKDIRFQFTVNSVPELGAMIAQAEDFLAAAKIGVEPGTYPKEAAEELQKAIDTAKQPQSGDEAKKKQAELLQKALKKFKESRNIQISSITVKGIGSAVTVGQQGTAEAEVKVLPDEEQYKKVIWSASDNIHIDRVSGKWTALYSGNAWIMASSAVDPSKMKKHSFTVGSANNGGIAVNLTKSADSLQNMIEKIASPTAVKSLEIVTQGEGQLDEADLSYINTKLTALENLNLKNSRLTHLPEGAFKEKKNLKAVTLPSTLTAVPKRAFYNCSSLHTVNIPSAAVSVGSGAFAGCTSLERSMYSDAVYPPEYEMMGDFGDAFDGTDGDEPASVREIIVPYGCGDDYKSAPGWRAFDVKELPKQQLTVHFTKSGGLETAAVRALNGKSDEAITDLIITSPKGIELSRNEDIPYLQNHFLQATSIDLTGTSLDSNKCTANTFRNRISLKKMRMPSGTTNIGRDSFRGCRNLQNIILPAGLNRLGDGTFADCGRLGSSMIINATMPPDFDGTPFPESIKTILVPAASVDQYKRFVGWRQFEIKAMTAISLNYSKLTMEAGSSRTLTAKVSDGNGENKQIAWKSSDPKVASVSSKGIIKGIKAGTARITASTDNGLVEASCLVTVKPVAPPSKVKAASYNYNGVKISWNKVSGAAGYEVWRATKKTGTYVRVRTVSASSSSCLDTGRTTGKTYYYKVRAYKISGNVKYIGDYSAAVSAKPIPKTPVSVKAVSGGSGKIKVSWGKVSGASGYAVYRASSKTGSYKLVKRLSGYSTVKYTNSGLKKGKTYYYKVKAYRTVSGSRIYSNLSTAAAYRAK